MKEVGNFMHEVVREKRRAEKKTNSNEMQKCILFTSNTHTHTHTSATVSMG